MITTLVNEPSPFMRYVWVSGWTWPLENRLATIQVLRTDTSPGRSLGVRALGHVVIAHEELAAGRLSAARAELSRAKALDPHGSLISRAYLLLSPLLPISAEDLHPLRREIAGWNPVEPDSRVWRTYVLGLLDERLRDVTGAERFASELEGHATALSAKEEERSAALAEDLALYLRARLAAAAGHPEEAWRLLDETKPERWWPTIARRSYLKQLYERWLAAEVLVELDRSKEALHWLAGLGSDGERSYMGIRHIRMAEIHEQLGNLEQAMNHYGRFITYWNDADPELQPQVEAARRAMQALSGES